MVNIASEQKSSYNKLPCIQGSRCPHFRKESENQYLKTIQFKCQQLSQIIVRENIETTLMLTKAVNVVEIVLLIKR